MRGLGNGSMAAESMMKFSGRNTMIKLIIAEAGLLIYEAVCDGSRIGFRERWGKVSAWADGKK